MRATLRPIGNSVCLILPKKVLEDLNAAKGDDVTLVKTKNGYEISRYDAQISEQIDAAQKVMKKYRNTFKKLADS